MSSEEKVEKLRQLIAVYQRRLVELEKQQAMFGATEALLAETDRMRKELDRLGSKLQELSGASATTQLTEIGVQGASDNVGTTNRPAVSGDAITVGDISGSSGIAIRRAAQSTLLTFGGDYAEGNIDKRQGIFGGEFHGPAIGSLSAGKVTIGDQMNISNVSGSNLNIRSSLSNTSRTIGASPHGDAVTKAQLQALIEQLSMELQKAPAERASEAEAVVETAKAAVEHATKAQPNKTLVQISAEGLRQAAQNLAAVLPTVLPIANQIAEAVRKMIGV